MTGTPSARRLIAVALLVGGVFWTSLAMRPKGVATAGVRQTPAPEHFLAGSERSVPILQEISQTLKQIDARLARVERLLVEAGEDR